MNTFIKNSIDHDLFQVEDVENDNACFYRSMANGLGFISKNTDIDILDKFLENENKNKLAYYRPVKDFYCNTNWGYNGDYQDVLARDLQQLSLDWIKHNCDKNILLGRSTEDPTITINELIMMVHGLSYSEYIENYQYFAGDLVLDEMLEDNSIIISNRWGGYSEQFALSEKLKLPIIILTTQKYDTRLNKIINGRINNNRPIKGVRFKIYQTSGLQYLTRDGPVIYLLWKQTKFGDHYMVLYPNDPIICIDKLNDILNN